MCFPILQMATFVLEENTTGWAAAAPLLLPLRPTALVAEEVAWLQARHPGRVGIGVAAGALPLDFEVAGVPQAGAVGSFKEELPRLAAMLRGEELGQLEGDPALLACRGAPVPMLSLTTPLWIRCPMTVPSSSKNMLTTSQAQPAFRIPGVRHRSLSPRSRKIPTMAGFASSFRS